MGKVKRKLKRVRLHREGTNILLVTLAVLLMASALVWWLSVPAGIVFTSITGVLYALLVNFFPFTEA